MPDETVVDLLYQDFQEVIDKIGGLGAFSTNNDKGYLQQVSLDGSSGLF